MSNMIVELYGNPVLFVITLLFILLFVGMTYEFILRLIGKPSNFLMNANKKNTDEKTDEGKKEV